MFKVDITFIAVETAPESVIDLELQVSSVGLFQMVTQGINHKNRCERCDIADRGTYNSAQEITVKLEAKSDGSKLSQ